MDKNEIINYFSGRLIFRRDTQISWIYRKIIKNLNHEAGNKPGKRVMTCNINKKNINHYLDWPHRSPDTLPLLK